MNDLYIPCGSVSKIKFIPITYQERNTIKVACMLLLILHVELKDRFSVISMTLLFGMAGLDPSNSFSNFDKGKEFILARLCLGNFGSEGKIGYLRVQRDT
jgi:hypothetical protein